MLDVIGINPFPPPNNNPNADNNLKRTMQEEPKATTSDNTNINQINKRKKQNIFHEMQEKNRYGDNISGPYIIQMTSKDESQNLGNLHPLQLGKKIAPLATQLQKINKLGKDKIQLTFNNHIYANEFIEKSKTKLTEWYTYIPDYKIYRRIIVYDIPKEMGMDEIQQGIEEHNYNPEVVEIERLMRYDKRSDKLIPTNAIKLVIKGDLLPQSITIWYVKCETAPIKKNVKKCYNCLRYGHTSTQCRGQKRCQTCSEADHLETNECKAVSKCANCKGNHSTFDINCPSLQYQKILATTMSYFNVDHKKAKDIIRKNNIISENQIINLYYKDINKKAIFNWNEKQFLNPQTLEEIEHKELKKPGAKENTTEKEIKRYISNDPDNHLSPI